MQRIQPPGSHGLDRLLRQTKTRKLSLVSRTIDLLNQYLNGRNPMVNAGRNVS